MAAIFSDLTLFIECIRISKAAQVEDERVTLKLSRLLCEWAKTDSICARLLLHNNGIKHYCVYGSYSKRSKMTRSSKIHIKIR